MTDCIFCKIVKKEIPSSKIYEDGDFYAFLDINPVNKGHTLLVPKKHCENLLDFPKALEEKLMTISKKISDAILKSTGAEGFNLTMNNGKDAGQIVFHAHVHIIPRLPNDGHKQWEQGSYEQGEMQEVSDKILSNM